VLRKLGAGGMGEVYLAEDERLGRRVALKCPSDDWLQSPDARERLHREARAAARLNDPRIASVYDVLDVGGRPYIVLEHVEGETLSQVLARGPLPVERAIAVGIEIAEALQTAHAAGVIHRDLKPGNVMLTSDGRVKILDFGLAKTIDAPGGAVTATGQVIGTPGYIAPELLLGRPADPRTDVYSVGALLYELLTGRVAVHDHASHGLAALLEPVPDIRSVSPSIPSAVGDVVMRALAKEPQQRIQSAEELAHALVHARAAIGDLPTAGPPPLVRTDPRRRWLAVAIILALVAAAGVPFARWWRDRVETPVSAHTPVVAVLPFTDLTGDPKLQYVGAGMAETIGTKLAGLAGLSVVSRAEVHEALQRNTDETKVCRALGVTYAVTGGIQHAGGRIQVTIQILSPDGRKIIPGGGSIYEDTADNLFGLQRRIAEDVSGYVGRALSAADREQLNRPVAENVQALSAYWRGRALMDTQGPEPIDPAIAAFRESVTADSRFALGYAGLGGAYWRKYDQTRETEWASKAVDAAEKARQLDQNQAEVRIALATVYKGLGRADDAIAELTRALELQPASYDVHRLLGDIHAARGDIERAAADYGAAIRTRPDYAGGYRSLGVMYMNAGKYTEAAREFQRMIELLPESPFGHQLLGNVHVQTGDLDSAVGDYQAAIKYGGSPATYSTLGTVQYLQGRFSDAASSYQQAIKLRPKSGTTHWNLGEAYRRLGRAKEARAEYATAVALFDADLGVNPKDALAMAKRASCLAGLGRLPEAIGAAERADLLAPRNPEVQYHRARVLMLDRQTDAAIDALSKAVASGYSVTLISRDGDLAPLRRSKRFETLVAAGDGASRRSK
jgi:tetratricopeptide (TPR) repeat protein